MLTKRTNILFDEQTFHMLSSLAKSKSTSIGSLVRTAVKHTYANGADSVIKERKKWLRKVIQHRKKLKPLDINITELVHEGRKFE